MLKNILSEIEFWHGFIALGVVWFVVVIVAAKLIFREDKDEDD